MPAERNAEPTVDRGQKLSSPAGKVIGFVDTKEQLDAFSQAAQAAGHSAAKITSLYGEDGIHLLERQKERSFFFGDSEDSIIRLGLRELQEGHFVVAVEVADHRQATQIASMAEKHGGHGFTYFGTWVSEQLTP